jgi:hypothetical protein
MSRVVTNDEGTLEVWGEFGGYITRVATFLRCVITSQFVMLCGCERRGSLSALLETLGRSQLDTDADDSEKRVNLFVMLC